MDTAFCSKAGTTGNRPGQIVRGKTDRRPLLYRRFIYSPCRNLCCMGEIAVIIWARSALGALTWVSSVEESRHCDRCNREGDDEGTDDGEGGTKGEIRARAGTIVLTTSKANIGVCAYGKFRDYQSRCERHKLTDTHMAFYIFVTLPTQPMGSASLDRKE